MEIDPKKVEVIITNLLSNAFKFTPDGGQIQLNAIVASDTLQLQVNTRVFGKFVPGIIKPDSYAQQLLVIPVLTNILWWHCFFL